MMFDFETTRRRENMGASKWEMMKSVVGSIPDDLVPFSVADMEFLTAPCITEALHKAVEFGTYGYTGAYPRYNDAVCSWFKTRHNWALKPEWLVQTHGVVAAMGFALNAFTKSGDGVIYQPPVYGPFKRSIEGAGRVAVPNPLKYENGRYEMDFDHLESLCAREDVTMLMLCSPHNPTGRVWTREELERVADITLRHNVLVFADEIHCDFVYAPHVHTPFATLSEAAAQNCVVGTAPSKTFSLAGLSTSNIVIPNESLRAAFAEKAGHFVNYFGIAATIAAYEEGAPWLDELKTVLQGNYEYCKQFLTKKFPSVTVIPMEGTYLMWADFRSLGLDDAALEAVMTKKVGLNLDEGYIFGEGGSGFERFVLACPRRYLEAAMARLDKAAAEAGLPR